MATKLIGDAVAFDQDEGFAGIAAGSERWHSAGYLNALARFVGTSGFVDAGLTFSGHDAANDEVDIEPGRCFVVAATGTMQVDVQSTVGGTASPAYDTTLQGAIPILIEVPTKVTGVSLQDSTASDVWIAYDNDGTGPGSAGSVYVQSDDTGGVSAPSHPSVKLGAADPDDSSNDTRANDNPTETFKSVTTEKLTLDDQTAEILETQTQGSDTSSSKTFNFTGLSSSNTLIHVVEIERLLPRSNGLLQITFNGDDAAANGNYDYWDETGTKQTNQDQIEVLDYDGFAESSGSIVIRSSGTRIGLDNQLVPARASIINGFCLKGGYGNGGLSSVQVISTGGSTDGDQVRIRRVIP